MKVQRFVPIIYKKSVLDINYKKLKEQGTKCLLFDLDNTLLELPGYKLSEERRELIEKLKKDFQIIAISNNFKRKISNVCSIIDIAFISFSMKPTSRCFKKVSKKYGYNKKEMCIIGDQLLTDILGGNNYGIKTILVEPLNNNDLKITKLNRVIENLIFKKLATKGFLERGIYYE